MPAIRETFGDQFIDVSGALDRAAMRHLVFGQPNAKRKLESILHPLIREDVSAQIAHLQQPYRLLVVPLLIETGAYRDQIARVLVVDCEEALQVTRTMARSRLTEAEVRAIMAEQTSRQARIRVADDVIENSGDISTLIPQIEKLHLYYLSLAEQAIRPDA
jgi:dephospho-CoA kinase